jgi:CHAT domain-containing protein/Flp pilus assembly protein TadD
MRNRCHLLLLAGMLAAFPGPLCPHSANPRTFLKSMPTVNQGVSQQNSFTVVADNRTRDLALHKAEADMQKAALLRERPNARDLQAAIVLFQESARLFKKGSAYDRAAGANLQIGEIYFILSQFDNALGAYREALRLDPKNPETRCQALSRIARTYSNVGQSSEADRYSEQALKLSVGLSTRTQAEALESRGEFLHNSGKVQESVEWFDRANALFAEANDANGQAQALLMLAYAHFLTDRATGIHFAREALRLWNSTGNRYGVAQAQMVLGNFASTTDEFETSQCSCKQALPVFHGIRDKDNEAIILNILGKVNREIGDLDASLRYYRNARESLASVRDLLGDVEAITGIAKALTAKHQYEELPSLYAEKLRLVQRARHPVLEASTFADMAGIYVRRGEYARAEALYHRSLAGYRAAQHHYGEGDVLIELAQLQVKQGKYPQAISSLERARELKGGEAGKETGTGQIEAVARINYDLAYIYRRLNRPADARRAIEKTIDIIEQQRLTISSFDSRASYFASLHKYYALHIQILMMLHAQDPEGGFAQKAFAAAERSKARSLLDLLTTSSQNAPCEELLKRQLEEVDAPDAGASRLAATPGAVDGSTVTLEQAQEEIGRDGTVLLEYALGDEKSYLWVVDQKQIVAHELPAAAQIRKVALAFHNVMAPLELRDGEHAAEFLKRKRDAAEKYEFYARQLSHLLLGKAQLAHAKRLLIVPDGSLQYIPFAALPIPSPDDKKAILISHHEVVFLPSASTLSTLRKKAAKRAPPKLVAAIFADPVFSRDDDRISAARVSGRKKQDLPPTLTRAIQDMHGVLTIPPLPGSASEAWAIAKILGEKDVDVKLRFAANRNFVLKDGLERYRLIHFATHGIIDAENPEMSGLILSLIDERGKAQDGYLRLGDIYKLKLSADLVVLSSCDSALGKDLDSEGIIGLPRGFLYAGAKSVIASLWKVNDDKTGQLMAGLYTRMHRGESPSSALRGAQIEMAQQGEAASVWAAFVLQGDYK